MKQTERFCPSGTPRIENEMQCKSPDSIVDKTP